MKPVFALAATGLAVALVLPSLAAAREVAYHYEPLNASNTYLIDWKGRDRARMVGHIGASGGGVVDHGGGRLITLDQPLSVDYTDQYDRCDEVFTLRWTLQQLMVRDLSNRTAAVVEIGQTTHLGGCDDGLTESFGDPDEPGVEHVATPMAKRPPMSDVLPGVSIAGFSEDPWQVADVFFPVDVAVLQAGGSIRFEGTGHVFPAALDDDQWLVIQLPSGPRAYTRLEVNAKTGGETWLLAEREGGKAQRVLETLVVKPLAGAGFGSVAQASRVWEWGLFKAAEMTGETWLYRDGTGERVTYDSGGEYRDPIQSWFFDGLGIVQVREHPDLLRERRWVPLRNEGDKHHWVLESEWWTWTGGEPELLIQPRVALFTDRGKAVRPPVTQGEPTAPPPRRPMAPAGRPNARR